jgi:hypothetical protein
MSSAAYAGLVPLRPSRVNIPSSGMRIGANGICYSPGYGSTSTGTHSRACRARDGWASSQHLPAQMGTRRGTDCADFGECRKPSCCHSQRPGMAFVNGPGVVIVPTGSGCDAGCIYRPGLEAARIGQWNRGSDHEGGRGRLLRTERRKRANSEPIRGDNAPRCRLAPRALQSCPRGRHRGRDTMCER